MMPFSLSKLNYKQKSLIAELIYLFAIGVMIPFSVGLHVFSWMSYTWSYVLLSFLGLPAVILFYRLFLPQTIGKKRYGLFFLLFPVYIIIYELNDRMAMLSVLHMPFVSESYRKYNIAPAHPEKLFSLHFNESFGYTGLVLLAATSLYVLKLLFKNQDNLNTLETEKLKLELGQLKSQLQPHFFFNTINNMYALSVQNSPKTPLMINDLSGIMRYMLYDTSHEKVPLTQEVEFIKSYINLENLRHDRPEIIAFAVQGNIGHVEIEPLLFLPLIENTFKHALHKDISDKWVKLVLAIYDDELVFQTSNPRSVTDIGYDKSRSGIGLMNARKRLDLLYPRRHELVIHEEEHIFTVSLSIKLKI